MNPFFAVTAAASNGTLPSDADATYYRSPAFFERIKFEGEKGAAEQLQILLYTLEHAALDPRGQAKTDELMEKGLANLMFYGLMNLVPSLPLDPSGPEAQQLREAIAANRSGPLGKATSRMMRRRNKSRRRCRQEDAVLAQYRRSLPWPDANAVRADPDAARATQLCLGELMDKKRAELRSRQQSRMAKLACATAPGIVFWTEWVVQVALDVLKPE